VICTIARSCCVILLLLISTGCQSTPSAKNPVNSRRVEPPIATLTLQSLVGEIVPTSSPTQTQPASKPRINPDAMLAYFQAKSLLLDKDQKGAIELLEKAVSLDKNYLPAQILLMKSYFDQGKSPLAIKHARAALDLDANDPTANYVLGSELLKTDEFKTACRYLYRAIVFGNKPGQTSNFDGLVTGLKLGSALSGKGYYNAALEVYGPLLAQMERLDGDDTVHDLRIKRLVQIYRPSLTLLMGELFLKLGRIPQAREYYQKAENIPEIKNQARRGMVRCYFSQHKKAEARILLDKLSLEQGIDEQLVEYYQQLYPSAQWPVKIAEIYKAGPGNLNLGVKVAEELQKNGKNTLAIKVLREILRVDSAHNQAMWLLVKSFAKSGKMDQAARILFDAAIHTDKAGVTIPFMLRNTDVTLGLKLADALKKIDTPADTEYARKYLLALAYQTAGEFLQADQYYRSSLELKKDFPGTYLAFGQMLLEQYRWSDASRLMHQALSHKLKNAGILYLLGSALVEQNKIKDAIAALEEARTLNPDSDQTLLALAETYLRSEKPEKAFDQLKQIIGCASPTPQTFRRLVQILVEADSVVLGESVLEQYNRHFGQDDEYKLLAAKLNFLKDRNAARYRSQLTELRVKGFRSGSLDRETVELEFDQGNFDEAVRLVDQALLSPTIFNPRDYQRLLQIQAFSYWKMLEYDKAELAWKKLLSVWPEQNVLQFGLARMYVDAQEYPKIQALTTRLLGDTENTEQKEQLQMWLIAGLMGQDKLSQALTTLDGWIAAAEKQDRPRWLRLKVGCLVDKHRYDDALALLDQWVEKQEPPVSQWRQMIVSVYLQNDQPVKALHKIDQYMARGSSKDRYFIEGLNIPVFLELNQFDDAIALAQRLITTANPQQKFPATLVLINCYQRARRYAKAIELARTELAKQPVDSVFAFLLQQQIAYSLQLAGQFGDAEKSIVDLMNKCKAEKKSQWQQTLVALYLSSGKADAGIKLLEEILSANPNLGWANNSLGYSLADQGRDLPRAEKLVRKALASEPGNAAYLDSLGWVCFRQGKYQLAYKFTMMAYRGMNEPDPVVLDHLGDISHKLHKNTEAREIWQQAVRACRDRDPGSLEPDMPGRTVKKLKALDAHPSNR